MADEFSQGIRLAKKRVAFKKEGRDLPSEVDTKPAVMPRYEDNGKYDGPAIGSILDAMRRNIESIQGSRGNPNDSAVTKREYSSQQKRMLDDILILKTEVRALKARVVVLEALHP